MSFLCTGGALQPPHFLSQRAREIPKHKFSQRFIGLIAELTPGQQSSLAGQKRSSLFLRYEVGWLIALAEMQ